MVVTLFGVVILVFVFYPIWLLGIVFLQNLKLTLFFLEDLGGMILIDSTKKKNNQINFLKKINKKKRDLGSMNI
jgi:hypothetical protein